MAVNTAGSYKLTDAVITLDVDGTPIEIECAATSLGVVAEANYTSHPRTGCKPPSEDYTDSSYTVELAYMQGFGTDGIFTAFDGLKGQKVKWQIKTGKTVSVETPAFEFDATVPALSPIPDTEWGEFAQGEISIKIDGEPAIKTTDTLMKAKGGK